MKNKTMTCYRWVTEDMTSEHNEKIKWEIGKWQKHEGEIELCKKGLHACASPLDSLNNVYGNRWFVSEAKGEIINDEDKFVASEMRLVKEIPIIIIKRFALFCAKQNLKYTKDEKVHSCVNVIKKYLDGKATEEEIRAAWAAAWAARAAWATREAVGAARAAAWAATRKEQEEELKRLIKEEVGI